MARTTSGLPEPETQHGARRRRVMRYDGDAWALCQSPAFVATVTH